MKVLVAACSAFIVLLPASAVFAQVIVKDEKTSFEAVVPAGWTVSRPSDAQEAGHQRYRAVGPDNRGLLVFYVFEGHRDMDLDRLDQLVSFLGQVSSERKIGDSVRQRRYKPGTTGVYEAAHFQVDGHNGYLVLAMSTSPDLSFADGVFQSFTVRTPLRNRLSLWWYRNESSGPKSLPDLAGDLLALAAFGGSLYFLWLSGAWIRRAVETTKALKGLRLEALRKGIPLGPRFTSDRRKATLTIWGLILGIGTLVCCAFVFLPSSWAMIVTICLLGCPFHGFERATPSVEELQDAATDAVSTAIEDVWK